METYTILICILIVASISLIAFRFISRSLNADRPGYGARIPYALGFIAAAVFIFSITRIVGHSIEHEALDRSTYTYYLDGAEVSASTIDIDLYDYKYDDENQKVYLTHKTPTDNSGIGFGIGWIARGLWN